VCSTTAATLNAGTAMSSTITFSATAVHNLVPVGTTATRACNAGYKTSDDVTQTSDTITCSATGTWPGFTNCVCMFVQFQVVFLCKFSYNNDNHNNNYYDDNNDNNR
jgi:hypothetical protein